MACPAFSVRFRPVTPWIFPNSRSLPAYPASVLGALELAAGYRRRLAPSCERIELTGSLRRRRVSGRSLAEVRIELLVVPKVEWVTTEESGLGTFRLDYLEQAVRELVTGREFTALGEAPSGEVRRRYRLVNGTCELVLWLAAAQNFGSFWLWRTGSRAHTDWLCDRARRRRACWLPWEGVCTGLRSFAAEEEVMYRQLGLRFIPPEFREWGQCEAGQYDLREDAQP